MRVKKAGGKIIGMDLTVAERKAMDMEIRRQCAEYNSKNLNEIDAMVLWHLHEEFGFGKKRLMRFYESFSDRVTDLSAKYEMGEEKIPWMYQCKLKDYGIDIEELNKMRGVTKCRILKILKFIMRENIAYFARRYIM